MSMALNLIMGARNDAKTERDENDFYATHPDAVKDFLKGLEDYNDGLTCNKILEPCAGNGHISEVFKEKGYEVLSWDLVQREYPLDRVGDFLTYDGPQVDADVVTNPPFKLALEFVNKSLDVVTDGRRVCMFLKVQFLEGGKRWERLFSKKCMKYVYVNVRRQNTARQGKFELYGEGSKTQCYCWFVFEKGFEGEPTVRWIK